MSSEDIARKIIDCFEKGGKLLICGNGGSAAESQHFAAELVGHFEIKRKALPAIALTTDTSAITAIGNDDGFDSVFSRQVEALGNSGDVLLTLSTSGQSENVLLAESAARLKNMKVVRLPFREANGHIGNTAKCQELHLKMIHEICRVIDNFYK